jgi:RNA polymerase sigma factor (sigma-70 family)
MVRQFITEALLTEKPKGTCQRGSMHRGMSTFLRQTPEILGAASTLGHPLSVRKSARIPSSPRRRSAFDASMATPTPPGDRPPEEILLENLKYIEKVIAQSCRNSKLSPQEAEDFEGHVKLKLIEDDYAVIRKFRGDKGATLKTYLATVITRALLDYKDHIWGKYHASAEAKELGLVAVRLEMLMVRNRYSFEEACEILRTNEGFDMSVAQLADLRAKLPHRVPKQVVGEESLQFERDRELRPDQQLLEKEREIGRRRLYMGLKRGLDTLPNDDQLLVKLWLKFTIADIARIYKVEQKPLYRRMNKILDALRKALERQGVRREDIKELLGTLEDDLNARPKRNSG